MLMRAVLSFCLSFSHILQISLLVLCVYTIHPLHPFYKPLFPPASSSVLPPSLYMTKDGKINAQCKAFLGEIMCNSALQSADFLKIRLKIGMWMWLAPLPVHCNWQWLLSGCIIRIRMCECAWVTDWGRKTSW